MLPLPLYHHLSSRQNNFLLFISLFSQYQAIVVCLSLPLVYEPLKGQGNMDLSAWYHQIVHGFNMFVKLIFRMDPEALP